MTAVEKKKPSNFEKAMEGMILWAHLGLVEPEKRLEEAERSFVELVKKFDDDSAMQYLKAALALIDDAHESDTDAAGRVRAAWAVRLWPSIPDGKSGDRHYRDQDGSVLETRGTTYPTLLAVKKALLVEIGDRFGKTKDDIEAGWLFALLYTATVYEMDDNGHRKSAGIVNDVLRDACKTNADRLLLALELCGATEERSYGRHEIVALNLGRTAPKFVSRAARIWRKVSGPPSEYPHDAPEAVMRLAEEAIDQVAAFGKQVQELLELLGLVRKPNTYVSIPSATVEYPSLNRLTLTVTWSGFEREFDSWFKKANATIDVWLEAHRDVIMTFKAIDQGARPPQVRELINIRCDPRRRR